MNAQEQAAFNAADAKIKADPDIKRILDANRAQLAATRDKGGSARDFQNRIRDQITKIAVQKGYIPDLGQAVFVNPNFESGQLELHRGWSGLSGWQKAALIAAAAAGGVGAGMALAGGAAAGAGGAAGAGSAGAGAAGAGLASIPATTGGIAAGSTIGSMVPSMAGTLGAGAAAGGAGAAGLAATPGVAGGIPAGSTVGATVPSMAGPLGAAPLGPLTRSPLGPLTNGTAAKTAAGAAGAGAAGWGGKLLSGLLKPETLSQIGRGIGAISETQASNRGSALDAMMEADKVRLLYEKDRRDSESDLWRKLQAADYMKSGGKPKTQRTSSSGRKIPMFGFGPAPISEANKQMASDLEPMLLERLKNPPQMSDYSKYMEPGTMESILNWVGPGMEIAGSARRGSNDDMWFDYLFNNNNRK